MKIESGFIPKGKNSAEITDIADFSGFQTLYVSKTGFFRILIGNHLSRRIIIKTLKEECADNPVAIAQLNKEFRILFPVDSPNVVHALSMTTFNGTLPAIEMEWCDGTDIRTLIEHTTNIDDSIIIIRGVLSGLIDIHAKGIVHRDIKPENVIYDPFRKVVKIIDFGCAWVTGGLVLQGPDGTAGYTPVEKQIIGAEAEPSDDLYALGLFIKELAESVRVTSKKEAATLRKLKKFCRALRGKKFATSTEAAERFEQTLKPNLKFWALLPVVLLVIITTLWLCLPKSKQENENTRNGITENATTVSPSQHTTADETNTGVSPVITPNVENKFVPDTKNNAVEIEKPKEDLYEVALQAGKLFHKAETADASPQIKMDAFVIRYCDTVYQKEELSGDIPRHIKKNAELDEWAKRLTEKHIEEMEHEFQKRFGDKGDRQRRRLLLQERFRVSLLAYHGSVDYLSK